MITPPIRLPHRKRIDCLRHIGVRQVGGKRDIEKIGDLTFKSILTIKGTPKSGI